MSVRSARTGEDLDSQLLYLRQAQHWLELAEGNRSELVDLHTDTGWPAADKVAEHDHLREMLYTAARLAEVNMGMAVASGNFDALTLLRKLNDLGENVEREVKAEPSPDEVAAKIRAQVKADEGAHQAATLRPGIDPEPEEAGALWTFAEPDQAAGEWFWYAVSKAPDWPDRWLMVQHYAQVLRWQNAQGTKPTPNTWEEIGHDTLGETVLRRPTDAERAAFYGPEPDAAPTPPEAAPTPPEAAPTPPEAAPTPPEAACDKFVGLKQQGPVIRMDDLCERCGASAQAHVARGLRHLATVGAAADPQPAIEEMHERTTTIPPIRLDDFTNPQGTSLADLADKELENLINSVTDECARRQRENGTPWRSPGGAGQWNG